MNYRYEMLFINNKNLYFCVFKIPFFKHIFIFLVGCLHSFYRLKKNVKKHFFFFCLKAEPKGSQAFYFKIYQKAGIFAKNQKYIR